MSAPGGSARVRSVHNFASRSPPPSTAIRSVVIGVVVGWWARSEMVRVVGSNPVCWRDGQPSKCRTQAEDEQGDSEP